MISTNFFVPVIHFLLKNYNDIEEKDLKDFFFLRKKIFKDKLNWLVECKNGMEFDEYDCKNTFYLFGKVKNKVVCACRFIDMQYENMCTGVFYKYFKKMKILNGNYVEVTRILIDKDRVSDFGISHYPINLMFFIKMQIFAKNSGYEGIYAVVTEHLLKILIGSGWEIIIQETGISEKNENIYLVIMPTNESKVKFLKNKLNLKLKTNHSFKNTQIKSINY